MQFTETAIRGAYILDAERIADERGFFARTWARDEFDAHGLNPRSGAVQSLVQSPQRNGARDALAGAPHAETKLVRCTQGGIYDVIVDIRAGFTDVSCSGSAWN